MSAGVYWNIVTLEKDFRGATYDKPLVWDHANGYISNSWCWPCRTYTKHGYNDYTGLGISERCCYNCGTHYAVALSVKKDPPGLPGWHGRILAHADRRLREIV